ncbi:MAG TPA: hypothetical protein VKI19_13315 [Acidimicrobiales bacterium]|nr:hypothetical protein [Acidimicrobiales bacterium]
MESERRAESDVAADSQEVTTREPDGAYVGRVAEDDPGQAGESGAERRAREAEAAERSREGEEQVRRIPPGPGAPMQHGENR